MPPPMQHLPPQHRVQTHAYYPAPVAFAAIPVMPAPPPPKRPIEVVDDEPTANKAKKSRTKAKPASEAPCTFPSVSFMTLRSHASFATATSSRRGYNAKKRSEAAQIAAQNGAISRDCRGTHLINAPSPPQLWYPCFPLLTCRYKIRARTRRPTEQVRP